MSKVDKASSCVSLGSVPAGESNNSYSFSFSQVVWGTVGCFSLFGCLFVCRCSMLRVEDVRGGEGVVQRLIKVQLLVAKVAGVWRGGVKQIFCLAKAVWSTIGSVKHFICPRWRRRRSASGQGSASRRQSCRSLEGGSQANLLFSQCCLIHYWLSERLGVNKKGTILCLYVEVLVLKSVGATANSVLVQYPIYLWLGCGSSVMDFYLILFFWVRLSDH